MLTGILATLRCAPPRSDTPQTSHPLIYYSSSHRVTYYSSSQSCCVATPPLMGLVFIGVLNLERIKIDNNNIVYKN
jgi:hypothetical protein